MSLPVYCWRWTYSMSSWSSGGDSARSLLNTTRPGRLLPQRTFLTYIAVEVPGVVQCISYVICSKPCALFYLEITLPTCVLVVCSSDRCSDAVESRKLWFWISYTVIGNQHWRRSEILFITLWCQYRDSEYLRSVRWEGGQDYMAGKTKIRCIDNLHALGIQTIHMPRCSVTPHHFLPGAGKRSDTIMESTILLITVNFLHRFLQLYG